MWGNPIFHKVSFLYFCSYFQRLQILEIIAPGKSPRELCPVLGLARTPMNMKDGNEFLGSGKCWHVLGSNCANVPSLRFDLNIRRFWSMAASSEIAQAEGQVAILVLALSYQTPST